MEFESIKRLGLDHIGIDTQKSFETYDQDTNNHIIIIYLLKSKNVVCPLCGSYTLDNLRSLFADAVLIFNCLC